MGHEEDYNSSNGNKAGPRADQRVAQRRAADLDHLAPAGRARRRGHDRHRARAAVHRRPLRRAGRLVSCPATRTAAGRRSTCRPPTPRRASPGTAPTSRSTCRRARTPRSGSRSPTTRRATTGRCCSSTAGRWATTSTTSARSTASRCPTGSSNPTARTRIAIAVWNLDGSDRRAGQGVADQLRQLRVLAAGRRWSTARATTRRSTRCRRARHDRRRCRCPTTSAPGRRSPPGTATVQVPPGDDALSNVTATLNTAGGLDGRARARRPPWPRSSRAVGPAFTWQVTAPSDAVGQRVRPDRDRLTTCRTGTAATNSDERIIGVDPRRRRRPATTRQRPAVPVGHQRLGPGGARREQRRAGRRRRQADHHAGHTLRKGLGTNSVSDVSLYLAGRCPSFTATVGVDDEQGSAGTVTFSVVADGTTLITTPRQTGHRRPTSASTQAITGRHADPRPRGRGRRRRQRQRPRRLGNPTLTCT